MPFIARFGRSGRDITFNGTVVKMGGIYAGPPGMSTTDKLVPPFDDDMKRLADNGNNLHRHIVVPYWKYSPRNTINPSDCCFVRNPGGLWDLRSYNTDYFRRLRGMIDTAANYGIAAQIVLFDRTGLDTSHPTAEHPALRWDDSPWNDANNVNPVLRADGVTGGLPEFYQPDPELRSTQDAFIRHVVSVTKNWNVFYEIMNEPMYGSHEIRVRWADWVVGVIHSVTGGRNLIFYNDHTGGRGADVNLWKQLSTATTAPLRNYSNFHGVIFHGVPTNFNPNNTAYAFRGEKIFQASTDTAPEPARDTYHSNYEWCKHCFKPDIRMMYQAHTNNPEGARGIKDNSPSFIEPLITDPIPRPEVVR
jgi:hypothetical protein